MIGNVCVRVTVEGKVFTEPHERFVEHPERRRLVSIVDKDSNVFHYFYQNVCKNCGSLFLEYKDSQ